MTAGVVKVRKPPRCGNCDRPDPVAICSRCDEPMCQEHFVQLTDGAGEKRYVCSICAEVELSARLVTAGAAGEVAA